MDKNICLKLSLQATEKAKRFIEAGEASRAFPHLLLAFKVNPSLIEELIAPFSMALENLIEKLTASNRFKDIHTCLTEAVAVTPKNKILFNKYYQFITSLYPEGAVECLSFIRQCITNDTWNLPALATFEDISLWAIERWHYRMVNDHHRNKAFRDALNKKFQSDKPLVLDIGTGSGLLSLYAVKAGAKEVYACETLPIMVAVASQVLSKHGDGKCIVVPKHSTALTIPDDIPRRVGLVVCEIVDSGLLGEEILQTLHHAWLNLLDPTGSIIPLSATFYMCGIQCQFISNMNRLNNYPSSLGLEKYQIIAETETYDTENLNFVPGGFTQLTNAVPVLNVNFNDVSDIQQTLLGKKDVCLSLTCTSSGSIDCLAGWFTLNLDDEIQLTTKPGSSVRCWDQAIFPNPVKQTAAIGKEVSILASFEGGRISVTFPEPEYPDKVYKLSSKAMKMLNDVEYVNILQKTAQEFVHFEGPCLIADFSPFPVLGLTIIKLRNVGDILVCNCVNDDQKLVQKIVEESGSQVEFMSMERALEKPRKFDVVLVDVIDEMGYISLAEIKSSVRIVKSDGRIFPLKVEVWGQLIESDWIRRVSQVENSENICPDIVNLLNQYKIFHHLDMRIESINPTARSAPFPLLSLQMTKKENIEKHTTVPVTAEGRVDGMLYWYSLTFSSSTEIFSTKCSSRINLAAILMDDHVEKSVDLTTVYEDGYFLTRIDKKT